MLNLRLYTLSSDDMDSSLLTLPPHLLERIADILRADVDLPRGLRTSLESAKGEAEGFGAVQSTAEDKTEGRRDQDEDGVSATPRAEVAVIEIAVVERLAKWSASTEGAHRIRKAKLGECLVARPQSTCLGRTRQDGSRTLTADPNDYTLISLLAGTQVYIPQSKLSLLESSTNPDKVRWPFARHPTS